MLAERFLDEQRLPTVRVQVGHVRRRVSVFVEVEPTHFAVALDLELKQKKRTFNLHQSSLA